MFLTEGQIWVGLPQIPVVTFYALSFTLCGTFQNKFSEIHTISVKHLILSCT